MSRKSLKETCAVHKHYTDKVNNDLGITKTAQRCQAISPPLQKVDPQLYPSEIDKNRGHYRLLPEHDMMFEKLVYINESKIKDAGNGVFSQFCIPLNRSYAREEAKQRNILHILSKSPTFAMTPEEINAGRKKEIIEIEKPYLGLYTGHYVRFFDEDSKNRIYRLQDSTSHESAYTVTIKDYAIIGKSYNEGGHWTASINHSPWRANVEFDDQARLIQIKDIHAGDELLFDYGQGYWLYQLTGISDELNKEQKQKIPISHLFLFDSIYKATENYKPYLEHSHSIVHLPYANRIPALDVIFQQLYPYRD